MVCEYLVDVRTDAAHVLLTGVIDVVAAPAVTRTILRVVAAGVGPVVINLEGVTFLDSSGMRALVRGYHAARRSGVGYTIGPVPAGHVLVLTGFDAGLTTDPGARDEPAAAG